MGKRTGEFFEEQTPESLRASLDTFNPDSFDSAAILTHAEKWSPDAFDSNFLAAVNRIRLTAV
jgi:hypothetical protein